MQRDLVLIALFFALLTNIQYVEGKICPSLDIRNDPTQFQKLRNCTIIMGHLHFVLIDRVNDGSVFENNSFPELTEIVDYLMVFRVARLRSIGAVFPNLKIIRGRRLFMGYSLIIFRIHHLQEIGLTNLNLIGRGAVKIDSCPNLCYVNTIDWQAVGASMLDFPQTEAADCKDEFCPNECGGYCWNNYVCQNRSTNYCKSFDDHGKCVSSCPRSKVTNHEMKKCMSKEECETMLNGSWWVFNNTCIDSCPTFYDEDKKMGCRYVGKDYKKICEGNKTVTTLWALEELKGCTHIDGYLEIIRISQYNIESHLEEYLGNIVSITGYLKIGRSKAISSLEFLKNLTIIKGEILDNNKYSLFIFENQNLQRLWDVSDNFGLTIPTGTIGFHGNPQLCLSEIEKLRNAHGISKAHIEAYKYSNGYTSICNQRDIVITIHENNPTNITLSWQREAAAHNETVIGYTIYYIKAFEGNVTSFETKDECETDSWIGILVRENRVELKDLFPYTRYGYFIKTYTNTPQGEQTPIYYIVTASTEPSEPLGFVAEATSDTSIVLSWDPPHFKNGILSHYSIAMFTEEDYLPTIQQRNYCDDPHILEKPNPLTNNSINITNPTNCSCSEKSFVQLVNEDLTCAEDGNKIDSCIRTIYHQQPLLANSATGIQEVEVNETCFEFVKLQHFASYTFYLNACNKKDDSEEIQCGSSVMAFARTKPRESADDIANLYVRVTDKNAEVKWSPPEDVNSVVVSYHIEYKRIDSEHSKSISDCMTEQEYQSYNKKFKIKELSPGKYAIHVRAISLAGPGTFSDWKDFEIAAEDSSTVVIYVSLIAAVVVIIAFSICFIWYRKKYGFDNNNHLITSINPDYAGPIYVEDEWEIDRNDIDILRDLGHGSFGMVYQGIIKSRCYPCAIKTVTESASMPSRMEFLNEGAVMKTFNDAHHVIKLLGIVSRGQPPLVIMELMECGDLKSYLRRCREPSQNLTTNELYRMAVEIADGMAYLTAKKFVHRDLAARNCMVAADRTVKIGDFGMARDVYETDYYRKETVGLLPVRWMAPESLADGVFTSDSDVWSYGIVLWEMATLAEQPYQGLSNEEVFHFVKAKGRLDRPNECSDLLFEVMDACWMWRPNDRPTFSDIVNKLVDHVGEDFRLVAFCFSRQGMELALNAGPRVYNPPAMITAPEEDIFGHYDPSEEEVNLYVRESNRPSKILPFSSQRLNKSSPYQISPGSPSSTFSFNSS